MDESGQEGDEFKMQREFCGAVGILPRFFNGVKQF